mmetsp:Transcript_148650/g.276974  ORF Transcript_148650/g.276974 Transcript_148650/m.276974 type:complete len:654 (-) Transcript_148650:180-2141(-)
MSKYDVSVLDAQDEEIESNDDEDEYRAGHAPHRCTDIICLVIFAAALGFLGYITNYAIENGDYRRLYHGIDFRGRLCGVDLDDDNKTLGEYLYWCPSGYIDTSTDPEAPSIQITGLDTEHPICVSTCPASSATTTNCVKLPPILTDPKVVNSETGSFEQMVTYVFNAMPNYPSTVFAHRYCMPSDPTLKQVVTDALAGDHVTKAMAEAGEFISAWLPLLLSSIIAFICGYAFLLLIKWLAFCIVLTCIAILTVGCYAGSIVFIVAAFKEDFTTTGDQTWDIVISIAFFAVGTLFTVIACCAWNSIQTAIGCVEAACECMFALPTLILEPFINLIFQLGLLAFLLAGFALLISCGDIQKLTLQEAAAISFPGSSMGGVLRSFEWSDEEAYYLLYYLFMIFWCMELMSALGQFVVSYAVQLWYFTPIEDGVKEDVPSCAIFKGYCKGIFYHLGSLAFGSLIVALLQIFRVILGLIQKQTKAAAGDNKVVGCCLKCCQCCLWCFEKFIKFLNKNAYMDIAITSSNFCVAARRAMRVIIENAAAIAILNGATKVIEWLGLCAIVTGCVFLSYTMVTTIAPFNDETNEHYVEAPTFFAVICGFVAAVIARAFTSVFDTTADSVLYCFAVDCERRDKGDIQPHEKFAPPKLAQVIQSYS